MSNYVKQMNQAESATGFGPAYGPSFAPHANTQLVSVRAVPTRNAARGAGIVSCCERCACPGSDPCCSDWRKSPARTASIAPLSGVVDTLTNPWFLICAGAAAWYFRDGLKKLAGMRRGGRTPEASSHGKLMGSKRPKIKKTSALGGALAKHRAARSGG